MSLSGSKKWVNVCKRKSSHGSRKREACHRDIEQHEIKKRKRKEKQNLKNKNWMLSEHPNNNTKCCLIT